MFRVLGVLVFVSLIPKIFAVKSPILIRLEHALDSRYPQVFTPRGFIKISDLNSVGSWNILQNDLSDQELTLMNDLAESDGLYRMRALVAYNKSRKQTIYTFTLAKALKESQRKDVLWFSVDDYDKIVGITITPKSNRSESFQDFAELQETDEKESKGFHTEVIVRHPVSVNGPDTYNYLQQLEKQKEIVKDSFSEMFQKLVYLLPMLLAVFLVGFLRCNLPC